MATTNRVIETSPWDMNETELGFLASLPETIDVWHARPDDDEVEGTNYLTKEAAERGRTAYALAFESASMKRVCVARDNIVGVDLDRQTVLIDFERLRRPAPDWLI